jgi:alpha-beta hydrolase superfamily lysophospholipase
MNTFPIISRDGLLLAGYHWPSENKNCPPALLILIHGIAEHSGRYEHLFEYYTKNNFSIITMDLRGHGQSAGQPVFIPTVEAIFQDMDLLLKEARRIYPFCPAILYGHSMGGALVLSYTLNRFPNKEDKCPYQAIVVTSPWIRLARPFQPPRPIYSIIRTACLLRPSLNVPLRFDPHKTTRDEEIINSYSNDDRIRRTATLSIVKNIGGIAAKLDRKRATFHIPVLIQHGQADSITSHAASLRFAARGENIDFKSWPGCYHGLHHEPEREEIFDFTLKWIKRKVSLE